MSNPERVRQVRHKAVNMTEGPVSDGSCPNGPGPGGPANIFSVGPG